MVGLRWRDDYGVVFDGCFEGFGMDVFCGFAMAFGGIYQIVMNFIREDDDTD